MLRETVLFHVQGWNQTFPKRWENGLWMGKMPLIDEHVAETPAGRQLARTVTRRPENKRWSTALFAQFVCTPSEPKLSEPTAPQAQRRVYLTRSWVLSMCWRIVWHRTVKHKHGQEQKRRPRTKHW